MLKTFRQRPRGLRFSINLIKSGIFFLGHSCTDQAGLHSAGLFHECIVGDLESERFIAPLDEDYTESKRNFVNTALEGRAEQEIEKHY